MANKNDYISDNLITIRSRLRESAAAIRENGGSETAPAENPPEAAPAEPPKTANPRRQEEGVRAKEDLSGRLAKDLARIADMLADAKQQLDHLSECHQELQKLAANLDALTPLSAQNRFAAETDRLRLEYFRLKGRLEALTLRQTAGTAPSADNPPQENLKAAWIIAAAILLGAAIVAGVTAVIFM